MDDVEVPLMRRATLHAWDSDNCGFTDLLIRFDHEQSSTILYEFRASRQSRHQATYDRYPCGECREQPAEELRPVKHLMKPRQKRRPRGTRGA
jgi:hypothetical protein